MLFLLYLFSLVDVITNIVADVITTCIYCNVLADVNAN